MRAACDTGSGEFDKVKLLKLEGFFRYRSPAMYLLASRYRLV
jgi:hypothetical protein